MAVNKKNLRYCQVKYSNEYYDLMLGVNSLDEVDGILQDWALNKFNATLDLPAALIINKDITDVIGTLDIDSFVYIDSPVSSYIGMPRFAGLAGDMPIFPTSLVNGYYVLPDCLVYLYSGTDFSGYFGEYIVESQNFVLAAGINYFGIDFNAGAPVFRQYSTPDSFNFSTIIPVIAVLSFGGSFYNIPFGQTGAGLSEKLLKLMNSRKTFDILNSFTLGLSGLYVELGAVDVSNGTGLIICLAMDTETTGHDMYHYYKDASSVWQTSRVSQVNNTQYQSLSGLANLASGQYVINYIFRVIDSSKRLMFNILSGVHASLQDAINSGMISDIPDAVKGSAVCVGRVIMAQGATSGVVQKVQKITFGA